MASASSSVSSLCSVENFPSDVVKKLTKELLELQSNPLEGIFLQINEQKLTDIEFFIDGPDETPFAGGKFRIKLILPADFPHSPPRGYFLTKIFHPNISPLNGEICVNTLKKDWKSSLGIRHVFLTIKCLLISPNAESALNEEAGRLLLENYSDYVRQAKFFTEIHATEKKSKINKNDSGSGNAAKRISGKDEQNNSGNQKQTKPKKILRRL